MKTQWMKEIESQGFSLIRDVFTHSECDEILSQLSRAMKQDENQFHVRQSRGTVFAARNILDIYPEVVSIWKNPNLVELLADMLGPECGLVRALFFDKSSERSWSLPFHKDLTIAVKDNSLPSTQLTKPTRKAGVPHVEASEEVLLGMLTLRIHLDVVTEDNGPLQIFPGSHLTGKVSSSTQESPVKILCAPGDVLAMRPMVSHGSAHVKEGVNMHRRILHLEFSHAAELPDEFEWHRFETVFS